MDNHGIYWLMVVAGWAMLLHFANERWWAPLVPAWGLYKRIRVLEKLSIELKWGIVDFFDFEDVRHEGHNVLLAQWIILFIVYLYAELLLHIRCFWKLAKMAGEDFTFAIGMVLCPPLFMMMLWNQNEKQARAIQEQIRQCDQEKKEKRLEENWRPENTPVWKCSGCGAQWPMERNVCRECGARRRDDQSKRWYESAGMPG